MIGEEKQDGVASDNRNIDVLFDHSDRHVVLCSHRDRFINAGVVYLDLSPIL